MHSRKEGDRARLEEHFRAPEPLAAYCDDVTVRQLIGLLLVRALRGGLHLRVEVQGDVGELLLHVTYDFTLRLASGAANRSIRHRRAMNPYVISDTIPRGFESS